MLIAHCILIPDTGEPGVAHIPVIRLKLFLTTTVCKGPGEFPRTSAWTLPLNHERLLILGEARVWWTLGKKERGKKNDRKMENRAGTSSRFIWGCDSEPLEKEWRLKPGPQMGGGYTKGVVTSRHGMSKPPLFFSGVWEIKEGKIGLFYSLDPWTQWGRVKTVPGNNLSSHYLNPLRMRTAGHAPGLMLHLGDEKRISEALYF